jgi:membrane-associated protein
MDLLAQFVDLVVHLDRHLLVLTQQYGVWVYAILFAIVFAETGFVVTPFLPGDTLLFVAGALAAAGNMDAGTLGATLVAAALCGDNVNYWLGRFLGPRLFHYEGSRLLKRENLDRTHAFLDKYGLKAIILARFVPVVRTFMPFVCGLGRLEYPRFLAYSLAGALLWVSLLLTAGYFFGNLQMVKDNLTVVVLLIVFLSVLPMLIEYLRHRRDAERAA